MSGIVWGTVLLICVLLAFCVIIWYLRSMYRDDSKENYNIDMAKMAHYIRAAKAKESKAWNNALSVMPDDIDIKNSFDNSNYQTVYDSDQTLLEQAKLSAAVLHPKNAAPTFMQQAFFNFWKIPIPNRPVSADEANRFIEEYKATLKADGFAHRVHRWNRLELIMGRFCSEYDIAKLNSESFSTGVNKPILDIFLDVAIQLLSKKTLSWKELTKEHSYGIILDQLNKDYGQLNLFAFRT